MSLSYEVAEQGGIAALSPNPTIRWSIYASSTSTSAAKKCESLRFIESYLNGGSKITTEEINANLSSYATKYHPQTAKEMAAITAVDRIKFWEFEDDEGQAGLEAIKEALTMERLH